MLATFRHVGTRAIRLQTQYCFSFRSHCSSSTSHSSLDLPQNHTRPSDDLNSGAHLNAKILVNMSDIQHLANIPSDSNMVSSPSPGINKRSASPDESETSQTKRVKTHESLVLDVAKPASSPLVQDVPASEATPDTAAAPPQGHQLTASNEAAGSSSGGKEGEAKGQKDTNKSARRGNYAYPGKSRKGKEKDTKNAGRRSRKGTRRNEDEDEGEGEASTSRADEKGEEGGEKSVRLPKRMCALLIGFCGTGCSGMQIQPNVKTIEGILFDALVKVGAVSQDNADDPTKVGLQRAARTDAGVHAAGNLVNLKMITVIPDLLQKINEELPPEIRLWGYVRVLNSFNARGACDSRRYTYFFPSYCLLSPRPGSTLHTQNPSSTESNDFWKDITPEMTPTQILERKRAWRIGEAQMTRLRETAEKYVGTHNFHNFTVGREFTDRSNHRFMKKIEIAEPAVYGQTEWISVMFHGQSFMLHQRKMMSGLVLSCRTNTPAQVIEELYGPKTVMVPKMPSLGLLLEYPIFDSYNAKVATINEKLGGDESHVEYRPPISFEKYREQIDAFKQKYIYDAMREVEDKNGVFDAWIRLIDSYAGEDLSYLNPKGVIPPSAVIKRGERRKNPLREKKMFDTTDYTSVKPGEVKGEEMEDEEEDEGLGKDKAKLAEMEG